MRNTYDSKNPFNKGNNQNQQSKERDTYTTVNPKQMSFQKQGASNNLSNNDKMTKFILETLKKLSTGNEAKYAPVTMLKPNQKTLLNTIAILLYSFDSTFQEANLNIDMLPDLFKVLGYPNIINKTYFQPVGAPHTWSQCLAMMHWLAQLANFHHDIRIHLEEGQFESDFTTMLIKSYLEQTPDVPRKHLQNQIYRKSKQIDDHIYVIKTHNLSIDNLKGAQKDLSVMQDQQKRFQSILKRQREEVIQVDQQNSEMIRKLNDLDSKIEEKVKISQMSQRQIISLKKQIDNQQLSVEEVQRIRFQIKQYHDKILEIKRSNQIQKQNIQKIDINIVNQYIEFNKILQTLKNLARSHRFQIQKRNIYFNIPECNAVQFMSFLKDRKSECSQVKIQQMLGIKQIKQVRDKAEILLSLIDIQLRNIDISRQQIGEQNKKNTQICQQNQLRTNELQKMCIKVKQRLENKKTQYYNVEKKNQRLLTQISNMQKEIEEILADQDNEIVYLNALTEDIKQKIQFKKLYQLKTMEAIQNQKKLIEQIQTQMLVAMEQYYQSFVELNECVDHVEYVQKEFTEKKQGKESLQRRKSMKFANEDLWNESEQIENVSRSLNGEQNSRGLNEQQNSRSLNEQQNIEGMRSNMNRQSFGEINYKQIFENNRQHYMSPPNYRVNRMNRPECQG